MTRKDYVLIAEAVRRTLQANPHTHAQGLSELKAYNRAVELAARELADGLYADNPRFDRGRFLRACGVEG